MQLLFLLVLIFSIIVHEVAHGYVADKLGDPTARYAGRLTLNPLPHIDLLGSIILPLLSVLAPGGFIFGWAKPVPYNPYNLRKAPHIGEALVAGAGPFTNVLLALLFALIARFSPDATLATVAFMGVLSNLWLAFLNMVPVPPLDGSKVLSAILPRELARGYDQWRTRMEMNPFVGLVLVLVLVVVFGGVVSTGVYQLAAVLAGV